ncbi:MAG: alpha/beta hydrolase [Limnospira sp. PMC 1291.21]|uniref:alpha/beta hydrolase n=1 Tax=unclassified Limnospira TaxID=2642885 RepID=UPI0028E0EC80|nr:MULTISPECIES: alpha/beta hydrolase [unclassified Limnospira]MDT9201914.1 alpha/beta hydrolase [Limnospira sp. PMC 1243.20]MDT9263636.1 alpha/beta hydrolase [Limnospira sp. PMC 1223.20]MDT9288753.1 alpha/beta hydrolase [Limnospira sp. PMC 1295.21]MDT9298643.1 alpha/beta hydrolase [Limnospira sp. PMC 1281.21]MDT9303727.1 alpha/beta hydrolase [Limnospira sp. PMC 1291.21]
MQPNYIILGLKLITLGVSTLVAIATPTQAADFLRFSIGNRDVSIPVDVLETYIENPPDHSENHKLDNVANLLSPKIQTQLRDILARRYQFSDAEIRHLLSSPMVADFLIQMGDIIETEPGANGADAIRNAMVSASSLPDGFTLIDMMREFPSPSIYMNLNEALQALTNVAILIESTNDIIADIKRLASSQGQTAGNIDFSQWRDLRKPGKFPSSKYTYRVSDSIRDRQFNFDLYLPETTDSNIPTLIISHGLASDRSRFEYLARHLASYGFAVAVPQHTGSDFQQFQDLLIGKVSDMFNPREFIDRPLDISQVLDYLESLNRGDLSDRLNLDNVGVLGHSLGGYTALVLGGAPLNFAQLKIDCNQDNFSVNPSLFLQCRALELPQTDTNLRDERVNAILLINPLNSSILGEASINQIQIPVMMVASGLDILAPAVLEQIPAFNWLTNSHRYLVFKEKDSHFFDMNQYTAEAIPNLGGLTRPATEISRGYMKSLSVAFFQTHITNNPEYEQYLQAAYAIHISDAAYPIHLILPTPDQKLGVK